VLFVSHNMVALQSLCTRAICLHEGKIVFEGQPGSVISNYLQKWLPTFKEVVYDDINSAPGNELIRLRRACVRPADGTTQDQITVRTPLVAEFEYWKLAAHTRLCLSAEVFNEYGVNLFTTFKLGEPPAPAGLVRGSFIVPADLMNNGIYRINLAVHLDDSLEIACWEDVVAFEVHDAPSVLRGSYHEDWPGALRPNLEWNTELLESLPASVAGTHNRG
jgi:lipopolysaccharide transport system ATP-binding protein